MAEPLARSLSELRRATLRDLATAKIDTMNQGARVRRRRDRIGAGDAGGTTLVELLIALAIAALLLAIAMPAYDGWIADYQVDNAARSLASSMEVARSEAIKRGTRVNLCKSTDGRTCTTTGAWDGGFVIHVDSDHDGSVDPGQAALRVESRAPPGVYVRANAPLDDYVSYTPLGVARKLNGALQMGTMRVCKSGRREVDVVLANSGRVRIQKTALTCP